MMKDFYVKDNKGIYKWASHYFSGTQIGIKAKAINTYSFFE